MSGSAGMRGYLVQVLVALIDALDGGDEWTKVTVEPNVAFDKVDILWTYSAKTKAVQVKSSQNQFAKPDVEGWAEDLEGTFEADEYELVLIGPTSQGVIELGRVGKVVVPPPMPLNLRTLTDQAAHRLAVLVHRQNLPRITPDFAEALVLAVTTKLETYSTGSKPLGRDELRDLLSGWISTASIRVSTRPSNVPAPTEYFTGRDEFLDLLHETLTERRAAAITQGVAVNGLGGIGKTQTAFAYARKFEASYSGLFLVRADEPASLISGYRDIAELFDLAAKDEPDADEVVKAVKRWLARESGWLMICDNADDPTIIRDFLPSRHRGSVLLTTRAQTCGDVAESVELKVLDPEAGAALLLRRAGIKNPTDDDRATARRVSALLGGLPLALDQAGAYIRENPGSLHEYEETYRQTGKDLRASRGEHVTEHPDSVAVTFRMAFEKVAAEPAAADFVRVCALLGPEAIPVRFFLDGGAYLGNSLTEAVGTKHGFNQAVRSACRYSLVRRNEDGETFDIHRLVQEVVKDETDEEILGLWAERIVRAMNAAFPYPEEIRNWPLCKTFLPHAFVVAKLIDEWKLEFAEAVRLLNQVAIFCNAQGRLADAEPLYRRALDIQERILGPDHPETAVSLNNLAHLLNAQGRLADAESLVRRALDIRERILRPDHPETATSLNSLASLLNAQGRLADAEPLFRLALDIQERILGPDHPDTARSLNNLAYLLYTQGRLADAEPLHRRALDIRERILGPDHPETAGSVNNLALLFQDQGRLADAESLHRRALNIQERILGPDHPATALSLNNLASLLYAQGRLADAEPLYRRALDIRERILGPDHPATALGLNNLASLLNAQGRLADAEPLHRRALDIQERVLGPDHPDTAQGLNNLASLLYTQGRLADAEPLVRRALDIKERILGSDHPATALGLNNLAALLNAQGRLADAEPLVRRALDILNQVLGSDHPSTRTVAGNLADYLARLGR